MCRKKLIKSKSENTIGVIKIDDPLLKMKMSSKEKMNNLDQSTKWNFIKATIKDSKKAKDYYLDIFDEMKVDVREETMMLDSFNKIIFLQTKNEEGQLHFVFV